MPKLSIVLPTRERPDTLFHTIRTLVSQDYQNCEIIVSDNASKDNTKEVVESFPDPRIRYINTGQRVSMSDNWEFALRSAQGEFVTYIGDDDGFIPGAITKAMRLLEQSEMRALIWQKAEYHWPDYIEESLRNWITLRAGDNQIHLIDGRKKLGKLMSFSSAWEFQRLPCPYTGIVRKSLFDQVTESSGNGLFFSSISPDVFSGIALSTVVGNYLFSEYPFSVGGASRHSTGNSLMNQSTSTQGGPAAKFASEVSREYDPRVKLVPSCASIVMGEYLLAKQSFPTLGLPEPDWRRYVHGLIRSARACRFSNEILQSASHTVKMLSLKIRVPDRVEADRMRQPCIGLHGDILNFRVPPCMVRNIFDACQLIAGMLPSPHQADAKAPVVRFVKNMSGVFLSEAQTLYRSF